MSSSKINRRDFVRSTAAAGLVVAAPKSLGSAPAAHPGLVSAPTVLTRSAVRPLVIADASGIQFKNGGTECAVERAFRLMTSGKDVLDALIAGVNIPELDPAETGVGYGGLPNAEGVVQLDASCMHGPKRRAGAVAALEGVRTPSLVAKAVLEQTDHHLIVGHDAQRFARSLGFKIEDDLNTEHSRKLWLEWKRRTDPSHYLDPEKRAEFLRRETLKMVREGLIREEHLYGTINCDAVNSKGEVCGVTTTSGLSWKIPGRVGDSPILGAGLYVDGSVGAAGSTGRGEANLYNLCSFLIVEEMRRGRKPLDAGMEALRRIKANTVEKRLLNKEGNPSFGIQFYVLNARGEHAGVTMYEGAKYAVCTDAGPQTLNCEPLLPKPKE